MRKANAAKVAAGIKLAAVPGKLALRGSVEEAAADIASQLDFLSRGLFVCSESPTAAQANLPCNSASPRASGAGGKDVPSLQKPQL